MGGLIIGGALAGLVGVLLGGLTSSIGRDGVDVTGIGAAVGLSIAAAGGLMIGLAELDHGLQRRRQLGGRRDRLRRALRSLQPGVFSLQGGGGLTLRGVF